MANIGKGIEGAKKIMNVLRGLDARMRAKPNPTTNPNLAGRAFNSAKEGITNVAWRNRTGYGKLFGSGAALGLGYGAYRGLNNAGTFGLRNQGDFNEANLPFTTQSSLADKLYQQQVDAINKQYSTLGQDQAKALNDLYTALGYSQQDVYEQAARDMANINAGQGQPGAMTDAQYNAAINAAYSTPANEVSARAAAPTGSDMSGMVGADTMGVSAGDIRDLGKIGAEQARADRYISQTGLNADVLNAQQRAQQIPAELKVVAGIKAIQNQAAIDAEKRAVLNELFNTYTANKMATRGLPAVTPSQTMIQTAINEFNRLTKSQKKTWLESNLTPAELNEYRKNRGMSDTEIYVALRNGLI